MDKEKNEMRVLKTLLNFKYFKLDFMIMMNEHIVHKKSNKYIFREKPEEKVVKEPLPFLVINGTENSKRKEDWRKWLIYIKQNNQDLLVSKLEKIIKIIKKNELFYKDSGILKIRELSKKDIVFVNELGINNFITFEPAIIAENDDLLVEGAAMYLNSENNVIPLSFTELELLTNTIKRIDMFLYSQVLLMFDFMINLGKDGDNGK